MYLARGHFFLRSTFWSTAAPPKVDFCAPNTLFDTFVLDCLLFLFYFIWYKWILWTLRLIIYWYFWFNIIRVLFICKVALYSSILTCFDDSHSNYPMSYQVLKGDSAPFFTHPHLFVSNLGYVSPDLCCDTHCAFSLFWCEMSLTLSPVLQMLFVCICTWPWGKRCFSLF